MDDCEGIMNYFWMPLRKIILIEVKAFKCLIIVHENNDAPYIHDDSRYIFVLKKVSIALIGICMHLFFIYRSRCIPDQLDAIYEKILYF